MSERDLILLLEDMLESALRIKRYPVTPRFERCNCFLFLAAEQRHLHRND